MIQKRLQRKSWKKKDCKILIGLVKLEEWYSSEKEHVSRTVTIEKWDLENFRVVDTN